MLEARRSIYPVLVAEAAENATEEDIIALQASVNRLKAATTDSASTTRAAGKFYQLVAAASKNLVLGFLVNALHRLSENAGIEYDQKARLPSC